MTKTKLEKNASIEEQVLQLENQRKRLMQKQKEDDRKARTKRLTQRGAILESLISDSDKMSNEQVRGWRATPFPFSRRAHLHTT